MTTFTERLQPTQSIHRTGEEAAAAGRALREHIPRSAHALLAPPDRDPLEILQQQNATRLPELVPLRLGRMASSPFAFYRGAAALMAFDLAADTTTGLEVVACGDAHISNFGLYASPERTLVFDLNDFDEAAIAPWEWDLKRLVTSVVIAAQENAYAPKDVRAVALAAAAAYRKGMRELAALPVLQRYHYRADIDRALVAAKRRRDGVFAVLSRAVKQAQRRTADRYLEKVSELDASGRRRLIENPPLLTRVTPEQEAIVEDLMVAYQATLPLDVAILLGQFAIDDVARRVVGVGSVGTRCFIVVLRDHSGGSIILQVKEAPPSVLNSHGRMPVPTRTRADGVLEALHGSEGQRVVGSQRVLQAVSDPFLGHFSANGRDYYVRQFRDQKGSIEAIGLALPEFIAYVEACGVMLARAHAQSAPAPTIAGYLGGSDALDRAVVDWSLGYAERSAVDHERLRSAIARGQVEAVAGI